MATIISFMNTKGGVGRSTLARITANAFHHQSKYKTLLIDADPRTNLINLRSTEEDVTSKHGVDLIALNAMQITPFGKELGFLHQEYDLIFIDSPGYISGKDLTNIMEHSNLIIIPLVPSATSLIESIEFLTALTQVAPEKKVIGVNNMCYNWSSDYELRDIIKDYPIHILESFLSLRAEYRDASSYELLNFEEFYSYVQELKSVFELKLFKAEITEKAKA